MRRRFANIDARRPYITACWLSRILHWWVKDLLIVALHRALNFGDLYGIPESEKSRPLTESLNKEWQKELAGKLEGSRPRLWRALARAFGPKFLLFGIPTFIAELFKLLPTLLFAKMTSKLARENSDNESSWIYMAAFAASMLCAALFRNWIYYLSRVIGVRLKSSVMNLLYKKVLRLSASSMRQTTIGQIVNVSSNDVNNLVPMSWVLLYPIYGPIILGIVVWFCYSEMGNIIWFGLMSALLIIPVQSLFGFLSSHYRQRQLLATDERINLLNQFINGIRVIKFYCWEKSFAKFVDEVRQTELDYVWKNRKYLVIVTEIMMSSARMVIASMVLGYYLIQNSLQWNAVLPAMAMMHVINDVVIDRSAWAILFIKNGMTHLNRIEEILLLGEMEPSCTRKAKIDSSIVVSLNDVSAGWNVNGTETFTLHNMNLDIEHGELLALIGPVGSGKSSTLMSILGEIQIYTGQINVSGSLGYAAQNPWIFSDTLKENVLFGREYVPEWYNHVIHLCSLQKDITDLPEGDQTLVGERGVVLSGGQKSRISLARVIYSDPDVYFLDDPLSAVDTEVGRHIFEKCIVQGLQGKTRLLVTHQLQYLQAVDKIAIIENGAITACGTYNELLKSGVEFTRLLAYKEQLTVDKLLSIPNQQTDSKVTEQLEDVEQTSHEEDDNVNITGLSIIWDYVRAGNTLTIILSFVGITCATQTVSSLCDWWLSKWIAAEQFKSHLEICNPVTGISNELISLTETVPEIQNQTSPFCKIALTEIRGNTAYVSFDYVNKHWNLVVFCFLTIFAFIIGLARGFMFWRIILNSTKALHRRMLKHTFRLPIRYFDVNAVGKILNPFASDITTLDDNFPDILFDYTLGIMTIISSLVVIIAVNPWILNLAIPAATLLSIVYHLFTNATIHLQHLENASKGPVYSYLSATLQGLPVIRAFCAERMCNENFENCLDHHFGAAYNVAWCYSWMCFYSILIGALFVVASVFAMMANVTEDNYSSVGLCMVLSIQLMNNLHDLLEFTAILKVDSAGIDRCISYTKLQKEAHWRSDQTPPIDWPSQGEIVLKDVCFSYSESGSIVLKNISCRISPEEKVGIVGRTGAGKSSFVQCLFRFRDFIGTLTIDGVDISQIGLHELRSKVSIIPQDPQLFSGTVRRNLDPTKSYTISEIWQVLEKVCMAEAVMNMPGTLEAHVAESGANFSVGQRQLLCLARSLLLRNRIIVLDEATANVDRRTDEMIQFTLREHCEFCTVITVAHRLNTVIDYDRILVLEDGEIKEFGIPHVLLKNLNGYLTQIVAETGLYEEMRLKEIARRTFESRQ